MTRDAMIYEQLVAKINANPVLLPHFESDEGGGICPCCVKRIVELPDQREVERVLNTMIQCDSRRTQVEAQIYKMTHKLREELYEINILDNDALHRLYEMRNSYLSQTA